MEEMGAFVFTSLTRAVGIGANSYLLEVEGRRVVLDAGLHPRLEGEEALPQWGGLGEDSVDAVVVTHAHQDHVGALPVLLRRQRRASVFMTEATLAMGEVMLHNSVNVMLKRRDEGIGGAPLFTHREVDLQARRWTKAPLRQRFSLEGERLGPEEEEPSIEFHDAGHILGSAGTLIRSGGRTLLYTGDVNFADQSLMQAARFPEHSVDVLVIEATRGDRATPEGFSREAEERRLAESIGAVFERGGCVVMPLFALGKTQEMLALFHQFRRRGWLGMDCPIYIGGLGAKLTQVHDRLASQTPRQYPGLQLLDQVAPYVVGGQEARSLPMKRGRIYALSSGMMTEKTVSNTVASLMLSDPLHALFFVGYADPESPAGRVRSAAHGSMVELSAQLPSQPLRCQVEAFQLSGHASRENIREYVNRVRPGKVVLVHGDEPAVDWFRTTLSADLPGSAVMVAQPGVSLEL